MHIYLQTFFAAQYHDGLDFARICPEQRFKKENIFQIHLKKKKPVVIAGLAKSGIESLGKLVITSRLHLFHHISTPASVISGPRIIRVKVVYFATSFDDPFLGFVLSGVIIKDCFRQRVIWCASINVEMIASLPRTVSEETCRVLSNDTSTYSSHYTTSKPTRCQTTDKIRSEIQTQKKIQAHHYIWTETN